MAIAIADYLTSARISPGLLYLFPLVASGLTQRAPVTILLALLCTLLREWLGPFDVEPWPMLARNLIRFTVFAALPLVVSAVSRTRLRAKEEATLTLARQLQQRLLPDKLPTSPRWDLAAEWRAAKIFDGTFYDAVSGPGGELRLLIGDVSGKGMPAAALLPTLHCGLRMMGLQSIGLVETAKRLNQILHEATISTQSVRRFCAAVDYSTAQFEYINAGHVEPLLLPASSEPQWL